MKLKRQIISALIIVALSMVTVPGFCFPNEPVGFPYKWKISSSDLDNMRFMKNALGKSYYIHNGNFNVGNYQFGSILLGFVKDGKGHEGLISGAIRIDGESNIKAIVSELSGKYGESGYRNLDKAVQFFWVGGTTIIHFYWDAYNGDVALVTFHDRKAFEKLQFESGEVSKQQLDYYSQYQDMRGTLLERYVRDVIGI